ncbi:Nucleolar protein 6 [Cichlidogyrus casuarinus]|uniref:Nucleolar protein 6 n=1 Tax=Cichlidogyrus casuarinus TaxID=1844966 RepID=A0ABD2Q3V0_9PLAT
MKRLFIMRLHELLNWSNVPARITISNMLDVYLFGFVWRIGFTIQNEYKLLQKVSHSSHSDDTPYSLAWKLIHDQLPPISSFLQGLARNHQNSLPTACALVKRWLSSQGIPSIDLPDQELENQAFGPVEEDSEENLALFNKYSSIRVKSCERMCDVLVELLVVYAGVFSNPVSCPMSKKSANSFKFLQIQSASPIIIFMRFLTLLAEYDWEKRPLLININDEFTEPKTGPQLVSSVLKRFHSTPRNLLPAMVVCTPADQTGSLWTKDLGPTRAGLKHLQLIAKKTASLLRAMLVGGASDQELCAVFEASWARERADVVLHVDKKLNLAHKTEDRLTHGKMIHNKFLLNGYHKNLKERGAKSFIYWETVKDRPIRPENDNSMTEIEEKLMKFTPEQKASYWPHEVQLPPFDAIVAFVNARVEAMTDCYWDAFGGNWIALKWKSNTTELYELNGSNMNGMVATYSDPSAQKENFGLKFDPQSLINELKLWGKNIFTEIELKRPLEQKPYHKNEFTVVDLRDTSSESVSVKEEKNEEQDLNSIFGIEQIEATSSPPRKKRKPIIA